MYRFKKKKARKKREALTSLNSLARNARTFRKLSLSVRRIRALIFIIGGGGGNLSRHCRAYRLALLVATSAKTVHRTIFFRFAPSLFDSLA